MVKQTQIIKALSKQTIDRVFGALYTFEVK